MKKIVLFVLLFFLFTACNTYYHGIDGRKYIFNNQDTLVYTWQVKSDTVQSLYNEQLYVIGDTLYTVQYLFDSTFNAYVNYIITPGKLQMYQYYNVYSMTIMFYEIKKDLSFSFDPRHVGKAREKVKFSWPEQGIYFLGTNKSISSALDTIRLGDSTVHVLRVDVKYKYVNKYRRPHKPREVSKGLINYFYYPGLGPIFIEEKAKNYQAQVISIRKL